MTLIFPASPTAPSLHAFVIGVGSYPHAKTDMGTNAALRNVRDLASAADSAKVMCDWLIDNATSLTPNLGSLEVLISDMPGGGSRYAPRAPGLAGPLEPADAANIVAAGNRWLNRIRSDPGCSALFYACGHGANHGTLPVLFHSGLNQRPGADAYAHLNIGSMAQAFRQIRELASAFFFVDACGEFVPGFPPGVRDDGFISVDFPSPADRDKVWLLSAASSGQLAYPGLDIDAFAPDSVLKDQNNSPVKLGRFTQALIKGLNGASARWDGSHWSVDNLGLWSDLKPLHRAYFPSWNDKPFQPSQFLTPNDRFSIIRHQKPRFPVLVTTDPIQRTREYNLAISAVDAWTSTPLDSRIGGHDEVWLTHVDGDRSRPIYALATRVTSTDGAGAVPPPTAGAQLCHSSFFKADQPQFDQRVPIP